MTNILLTICITKWVGTYYSNLMKKNLIKYIN